MTEENQESKVQVVTSENFNDYVNKQMGIDPEAEAAKEAERLAAVQAEQLAKEKAEEEDPTATLEEHKEVPKEKRNRLQERFSKLTNERKEALEAAKKAFEDAEKAKREAAEAKRLADELKTKYEPPKTELDPEPDPSKFTDINEYSKALKEWTTEKTLRDAQIAAEKAKAEAAQQEIVNNWKKRQDEFKAKTEDYEAVIASSNIEMPQEMYNAVRDAIYDSNIGPEILYHLAKNKDFAVELGKMSVAKALKEIGKLEDKLAPKQQDANNSVAEISRAPAPISPLKGAGQPVTSLRGSDEVPKTMTYEEWKAKRKAGQIR